MLFIKLSEKSSVDYSYKITKSEKGNKKLKKII
jgi:hypothetical protein